jgi:hypothetical protein
MNRLEWAQTNIFISAGKVHNDPQKELALVAWQAGEASRARWNPLDTTYPMPGAQNFNGAGVKNYVTLESGLRATWLTLEGGAKSFGYQEIIWDLADPAGTALQIVTRVAESEWGTWRGDPAAAAETLRQVEADYAQESSILITT